MWRCRSTSFMPDTFLYSWGLVSVFSCVFPVLSSILEKFLFWTVHLLHFCSLFQALLVEKFFCRVAGHDIPLPAPCTFEETSLRKVGPLVLFIPFLSCGRVLPSGRVCMLFFRPLGSPSTVPRFVRRFNSAASFCL